MAEIARLNHLCKRCERIFGPNGVEAFDYDITWSNRAIHHADLASFQKAVEEKCVICCRLSSLSTAEAKGDEKAHFPSGYSLLCWMEPLKLSFCSRSPPYHRIGDFLLEIQDKKDFTPPQLLEASTSSKESLDLARSWLTSCQEEHKDCGWLGDTNGWQPSRLVDVGLTGEEHWKLHIRTEEGATRLEYMTLSHRWLEKYTICLTKDTQDEFRLGKPISDLPRTFREAIQVAHHFSIRYLWIDSLCIIQDSKADWATESLMMQSVYTNAICNIVAADCHGTEDRGIFRPRDPFPISSFSVTASWKRRGAQRKFNGENRFLMFHETPFTEDFVTAPLYKRGWVLQERLLSPRTLHFGKRLIFWSCRHRIASEVMPKGFSLPLRNRLTLNVLSATAELDTAVESRKLPNDSLQMWARIVEEYTRCHLTVASDKLIALSGIASVFQQRTSDHYLAGLWRAHLPECLSWRVVHPQNAIAKPLQGAPSWSWASVDAEIQYRNMFGATMLVSIIDAYVPTDMNLLADAVLTLKGAITPANITRTSTYLLLKIGTWTRKTELATSLYPSPAGLYADKEFKGEGASTDAPSGGSDVFLLPLMSDMVEAYEESIDLGSVGLILHKMSELENTYKRVGFFNFEMDPGACSHIEIVEIDGQKTGLNPQKDLTEFKLY